MFPVCFIGYFSFYCIFACCKKKRKTRTESFHTENFFHCVYLGKIRKSFQRTQTLLPVVVGHLLRAFVLSRNALLFFFLFFLNFCRMCSLPFLLFPFHSVRPRDLSFHRCFFLLSLEGRGTFLPADNYSVQSLSKKFLATLAFSLLALSLSLSYILSLYSLPIYFEFDNFV